jgi:hypothetical protein
MRELRRARRAVGWSVFFVFALVGLAGSATAQDGGIGVAMDPGQLAVADPIEAGGRVTLPPVSVRNPGQVPTTYELGGDGLDTDDATSAEGEWFTVDPTTVEVAPGGSSDVVATITVPAGTPAGRYVGLVTAQAVPDGTGTQVGAAVGVRVYFEVVEGPASDGVPIVLLLGAGIVVLAVVAVLLRRSGFRLRVERRRPDA